MSHPFAAVPMTVEIPFTRPEPGALCCDECAARQFRISPPYLFGAAHPEDDTVDPVSVIAPLLICAHVAAWLSPHERMRALSRIRRWAAEGVVGRAQKEAAYLTVRSLREFEVVA